MHKITQKQRNNLLEAARLIEANPERFGMWDWVCRTTACVAGWAIMVDRKRKSLAWASRWFNDLTLYEERQVIKQATGLNRNAGGEVLFSDDDWLDCKAKDDYLTANNPEEAAKAAADYVRWFVENHTTVEKSK